MVLFLNILNKYIPEKWLLIVGLGLQIIEMTTLSSTSIKLVSFIGRGVGAMAFINGPIITSIVSKLFQSHE